MKRRSIKKHRMRIKKAVAHLSKLIAKSNKDEFLTKAQHMEQMRAARKSIRVRKISRRYKK